MSWVNQEEELLKIDSECEREFMDEITCYYIFVNINNFIEKVGKENIVLSNHPKKSNIKIIPKGKVLQLIQQQKTLIKDSKYIYKDAYLYLVDLEHKDIQPFNEQFNNLNSDSEEDDEEDEDEDNEEDEEKDEEDNKINNIDLSEDQDKILKRFFKKLPLLEDIEIEQSINIFHNTNSIYFFFQEIEKKDFKPKPILKIHPVNRNEKPSKKKVTIKLNKKNGSSTRKNI